MLDPFAAGKARVAAMKARFAGFASNRELVKAPPWAIVTGPADSVFVYFEFPRDCVPAELRLDELLWVFLGIEVGHDAEDHSHLVKLVLEHAFERLDFIPCQRVDPAESLEPTSAVPLEVNGRDRVVTQLSNDVGPLGTDVVQPHDFGPPAAAFC